MANHSDNPGQGNRGGQEYGEDSLHKSQRNQDAQHHQTPPDEEKLKEEKKEGEDDNFSPGEDDDYDGEEFATD
ncbi:MAG: hypothetical protein EOO45_11400 [Flavobacterium sp.]|nr:MAG: hypothetical protein EOO45_11400 [Flavobacterium sp.]